MQREKNIWVCRERRKFKFRERIMQKSLFRKKIFTSKERILFRRKILQREENKWVYRERRKFRSRKRSMQKSLFTKTCRRNSFVYKVFFYRYMSEKPCSLCCKTHWRNSPKRIQYRSRKRSLQNLTRETHQRQKIVPSGEMVSPEKNHRRRGELKYRFVERDPKPTLTHPLKCTI